MGNTKFITVQVSNSSDLKTGNFPLLNTELVNSQELKKSKKLSISALLNKVCRKLTIMNFRIGDLNPTLTKTTLIKMRVLTLVLALIH
jgi:hypothetical protein